MILLVYIFITLHNEKTKILNCTNFNRYFKHESELWTIVFQTTAGISFFGGFIFLMWSSGEVQKWNDITENV